jgi:mannose-6-phosphate isomerase
MSARAIAPKFVPKIWGSRDLEPWFPNPSEPIGEVWFPAGELLIKFLFTTQNLSVQVHPKDDYAALHEQSRGKTEMWYILRAAPDAKVALGFINPIGPDEFRKTAESGEIVDRLEWMPAYVGDTFFVPAGTVHAIGGGLALCEIQQNSDVTYRVFDYGRDRGLHLEKALEVSDFGRHPGANSDSLVECEHFIAEKVCMDSARQISGTYVIILDGAGKIDGQTFQPGTVWSVETSQVDPIGAVTLLTAAPVHNRNQLVQPQAPGGTQNDGPLRSAEGRQTIQTRPPRSRPSQG